MRRQAPIFRAWLGYRLLMMPERQCRDSNVKFFHALYKARHPIDMSTHRGQR
jgi:hypothetical protein